MTEEREKSSEATINSLDVVTSDSTIRNDTIWHFTGPEALYEILKPDGCLFATHMSFLNDSHEPYRVLDALALLQDQVEAFARDGIDKNMVLMRFVRSGTILCPFVTCFCRKAESPLMWRVYTRNGGFAIGFRRQELLDNVICPNNFEFRSGPCRYRPISRKCLGNRKDYLQCEIRNFAANCPKDSLLFELLHEKESKRLAKGICELSQAAAFVKDQFFSDEKEFRLVFTKKGSLSPLDFEMVNGGPRLRIRFKEPLHRFVSEIKVSPLGDADENLKTARFAAGVFRIDPKKVSMFKCPVRR